MIPLVEDSKKIKLKEQKQKYRKTDKAKAKAAAQMREYRKTEKGRAYFKEYDKKYRQDKFKIPSRWKRLALQSAKGRAKKNNLEFNVTRDDLDFPTICPVLGIPILPEGPLENHPSLDRIDNSKGYVKGNVCVISSRANRIKSDASLDELIKLVNYITTRQSNQ